MNVDNLNLDELADDGDMLKLDDDRVLRLRIVPDEMTDPFTEFDCYGSIGWDERHPETGRLRRPRGFDGNAERIPILNDMVWWQPPSDVKRGTETFDQLRRLVMDLASFGMRGYIVELCEGHDAYGKLIVRDAASLWGIEPIQDDSYHEELVKDLVWEVLNDE